MQNHPVNNQNPNNQQQGQKQPLQSLFRVLLYSNQSEQCKQLISAMNQDHLLFCKPICIDHQKIREILNNSSVIKVEVVPCLLDIFNDGTVTKFEGRLVLDKLNEILNVHKQLLLQQQGGNQNAPNVNQNGGGPKVSMVNDVIGDPRMTGIQGNKPTDVHIAPRSANISNRINKSAKHDEYVYSSNRDINAYGDMNNMPMKGEGHDSMVSSLPDMGKNTEENIYEDNPNDAPQYLTSSKIIQDLDDYAQSDSSMGDNSMDDPSGMGAPRQDPFAGNDVEPAMTNVTGKSKMSGRSGQKGSAIKMMAQEMAAAREQESKQNEMGKQGPMQKQRQKALRT